MNLQPSALETDALPLSYSPKELDDLAALDCGYTSAVAKEADVYPFSPNVARVFRKKRSRLIVGTFVITIGSGCWKSPTAPPPIEPTTAPRAKAPVKPDVTEGEVGVWDADGVFRPSDEVPLHAGSSFGWRIRIPCGAAPVTVDEELRLPAPGDWPADPDMHVSKDLRSVTLHFQTECRAGWIEKQWSVSAGDPPGVWVIRVTVDGFAPKTFHASFHPNVNDPASGP